MVSDGMAGNQPEHDERPDAGTVGQEPPTERADADAAPGRDPREVLGAVHAEVSKAVMGQDAVLWGLLTALLVRGHVILEGVPGVAKTLLAKALAHALDLRFRRVQLTPDLMPSDITGNVVLEGGRDGQASGRPPGQDGFRFRPGPVFTNVLLADEVNRTPPKTQAALLEAMEEHQVTTEGESRPLPEPFVVVATQNPIEFEGTYPLPEAQLDRFLFKLLMGYPTTDQERRVVRMHDSGKDPHDLDGLGIRRVAGAEDIRRGAAAAVAVTLSDEVLDYLLALAAETRRSPSLALGVSPRGVAMLAMATKAWAYLSGRGFVTPDDVKALLKPAWRHRIALRPEVELEGGNADSILDSLVERVPVPR
jgi:MoxR-like ATPase